jgi:hypothetical protein
MDMSRASVVQVNYGAIRGRGRGTGKMTMETTIGTITKSDDSSFVSLARFRGSIVFLKTQVGLSKGPIRSSTRLDSFIGSSRTNHGESGFTITSQSW